MNYFNHHLNDVGESYFQHLRHAIGFAATMAVGSIVCLIHALCPFLFRKTGSTIISKMYHDMVTHRNDLTPKPDSEISTAHSM